MMHYSFSNSAVTAEKRKEKVTAFPTKFIYHVQSVRLPFVSSTRIILAAVATDRTSLFYDRDLIKAARTSPIATFVCRRRSSSNTSDLYSRNEN